MLGWSGAAEIFLDLHFRPNAPKVDIIMRARALKPADSSPYVNEVFNVEFIDHAFSQSTEERDAMPAEFRHTNYACPVGDGGVRGGEIAEGVVAAVRTNRVY